MVVAQTVAVDAVRVLIAEFTRRQPSDARTSLTPLGSAVVVAVAFDARVLNRAVVDVGGWGCPAKVARAVVDFVARLAVG
jgi:hypothetical protein